MVLNTYTNRKGLAGPSQLTRLKLKMRISTPIISMVRICVNMKALMFCTDMIGAAGHDRHSEKMAPTRRLERPTCPLGTAADTT